MRVGVRRTAILLWAVAWLFAGAAAGQFTAVSGTVTDPNGLPYSFGTIASTIVSSNTPKFSSNSQVYLQPTQATGLDINGKFLVQLADNTQLTPGSSTWTFTVCSGTGTVLPSFGLGPRCFTVTGVTISGASQDIGPTLRASAVALTATFTGGGGCTPLASNANGILFLNGTPVCTSSANFLFTDGATAVETIGKAAAAHGQLTLQDGSASGNFSRITDIGKNDSGWILNGGVNGAGLAFSSGASDGHLVVSNSTGLNPIAITAISRSSNVVTLTNAGASNLVPGPNQRIVVTGVTDSTFNGQFVVTSSTLNTITYPQTAANASSSGGFVAFDTCIEGTCGGGISTSGGSGPITIVGTVGNVGNATGPWPAITLLVPVNDFNGTNLVGGDITLSAGSTNVNAAAGNINLNPGVGMAGGANGIVKITGPVQTPAATLALSTTAIGANTCAAAQTAALSGLATSSVVKWSYASTPIGVTGYGVGGLQISTFASANTANVVVCNITGASITPGTLSLNLRGEL